MARKNMAERYAAQRSRRDTTRRRSLPRLSDSPIALQERIAASGENGYDANPIDSGVRADGRERPIRANGAATLTRRPQGASAVRRGTALDRITGPSSTTALSHVDYSYVAKDLRRIAVTAVTMLVLLIVLNLILQSIIH